MTGKSSIKERAREFGFARIIAVVLAVVAVAGWVIAGIFIETGSLGNETETETLAETLVENVTNEDYEAILELIDQSDLTLLRLLVWSANGEIPPPDKPLGDYELDIDSDVGRYIRGYFLAYRENIIKSNIKSMGSRKILEDRSYVVAIYSHTSDEAFPLMTKKSGGNWKIDMSAMIAGDDGAACSQYVIDSVNGLLDRPTRKQVDQALSILHAGDGMSDKFSLWLEPEAESLLTDQSRSGVSEGLALTDQFSGLLVRAGKSSSEVEAEEESGDTDEEIPVDPEVVSEPRTLIGEGSQLTQQFEVKTGTVVFHFKYTGSGAIVVELVNQSGVALGAIVDSSGPVDGSRALGLPDGIYGLKITCSGNWTIGIEEPAPASAPFPPQVFSAVGSRATGVFQTGGKPVMFNMSHEGGRQFIVTVMELSGNPVALLANAEGPWSGVRVAMLRADAFYVIDVDASGPWTISLENIED
ncbi:MAG: hypothetical protein JXA49_03710 [Actinobacteria bacterium]|nr:hypothetical protein [Actinomycetota bacterium]